MGDIQMIRNFGKKLAIAATKESDWPDDWPDNEDLNDPNLSHIEREFISFHSPKILLELYYELDFKDEQIKNLQGIIDTISDKKDNFWKSEDRG